MMKAAASTCENPAGSGMHKAAGARVCVPNPPVPDRHATFWPTCKCLTPSPTACTTPAYSEPGTKGRGGLIWYLFCTISRSGKLRLAALISISTSPAWGCGVGSSFQVRASTPVGFSQSQACMVFSVVGQGSICIIGRFRRQIEERGKRLVTLETVELIHENSDLQRRRLPGLRHYCPV